MGPSLCRCVAFPDILPCSSKLKNHSILRLYHFVYIMKFILSSLIAAIIVAVASATECSPTGYVCYGHTNGETEYCSSWGHKNAVCHNGQCYSPPDCSSASLGIKAPSGAGASCKGRFLYFLRMKFIRSSSSHIS